MCVLAKVAYSSGSPRPFVVLKTNKQTKNQQTKGTFTLMLICRVFLLFANYG